jgi:hypothetical protein
MDTYLNSHMCVFTHLEGNYWLFSRSKMFKTTAAWWSETLSVSFNIFARKLNKRERVWQSCFIKHTFPNLFTLVWCGLYFVEIFPGQKMVIIVVTFIQHIYNYIPDKNHVFRIYNVAAVLWLQCMLFPMINIVHFYISTFWICVHCPIWRFSVLPRCRAETSKLFCISLTSTF